MVIRLWAKTILCVLLISVRLSDCCAFPLVRIEKIFIANFVDVIFLSVDYVAGIFLFTKKKLHVRLTVFFVAFFLRNLSTILSVLCPVCFCIFMFLLSGIQFMFWTFVIRRYDLWLVLFDLFWLGALFKSVGGQSYLTVCIILCDCFWWISLTVFIQFLYVRVVALN